MKKIYSTLALSAIFVGGFAQQLSKAPATANSIKKTGWLNSNNSAAKTAATSTLMPSTFNTGGCATNTNNVVYYSNFGVQPTPNYTVNAIGYTFGTNVTTYSLGPTYAAGLGTSTVVVVSNRAAQKYNVSGNVSISQVLFASAIGEGTGSVTAKIYNENTTTKGPNTQVGVTATLALSGLTGYDALTFSTPVMLTGNFFASIESPAIGGAGKDTVAIMSTSYGCSSTDSLSWIYNVVSPAAAASFVGGGGWVSVIKSSGGTAADNLDFLIFPVADIAASTTGINSVSKGDLTLLAAFPNPATNEVNINFGLNQAAKTEINVFDVTGKLIMTSKLEELEAGNHTTKLDVSTLNAGVYMYSVKSNNVQLFSKFTVAK